MSKKTVALSMQRKPTSTPAADQWVAHQRPGAKPEKRLSINLPAELHAEIKAQCALRGENMAEVFRTLIEREFTSGAAIQRTNVQTHKGTKRKR